MTDRDAFGERPGRYAWYVTGVLMLAMTVSYIDRRLPVILVEAIKRDLVLSDTEVGLLTGMTFAATYAVAGIPMASLADRWSRKGLLGWTVLAWSACTALGGVATGFWSLAITRAGVAAGSAACTPASHSIIADYVPHSHRSRAISIFLVGSPLGGLLGLVLGGWISDVANWRAALVAAIVPGILLSLLIFATVREPERKRRPDAAGKAAATIGEVAATFWRTPALRWIIVAMTLAGTSGAAATAFGPAYVIRNFGIKTSAVGLTFGLGLAAAGTIGTLLGGMMGDKLRARGPRAALSAMAASICVGAIVLGIGLFAQNFWIFLACITVFQASYLMVGAPSFASIQSMVDNRMHAMASAIVLFGVSGIGLSLGPLFTGMISDALAHLGPAESLRLSLLAMLGFHVAGAGFYFAASRAAVVRP